MTTRSSIGSNGILQNFLNRKAVQLVLYGCVAVGAGIGGTLSPRAHQLIPCSTEYDEQPINMAQYESLKIGASLTDVRATLGQNGMELHSSLDASSHRWENCEASYIEVDFKEGKLVKKSQELKPCSCPT
jgi:hypothetical protein